MTDDVAISHLQKRKIEARAPACVVSGGNVDGRTASDILVAR